MGHEGHRRARRGAALLLLTMLVTGCEMLPLPASPEAQAACREVADAFEPHQLARVVAAFDTTLGGLITYQRRVGSDAGGMLPGQNPADPAFLCYVDGSFGPGENGVVTRVVIGYVPDPRGGAAWGVIREGTEGDVFVVAP